MKMTSALVRDLEPSATAELVEKTAVLRSQGLDVVSFGAGEPDFDTPAHIVDAAFNSLRAGFTHYVSSRGIPELRSSISAYLLRQNGISVNPDREIIVTAGSKMAIYICLVGLLDPGDEVLMLEPAWVSYDPMVRLARGEPVHVPLDWRNDFEIEKSAIESHVSAHTKAIIVNSPSNPTGHVLSLEELKVIERVATEHDLFVISDEIYDRIVYDAACISPARLPGLTARTLTTNGFSKAYAMTGWRLGYVAGSERLIGQILRVQQHVVTCATSFVQAAGVAALDGPQEPVEAMIGEYRRRRDLIVDGLNDLPGVTCTMPIGAFYVFPRFEGLNLSSQELATRLLDERLVVTTPGSAFGAAGEGHLRLSYACATEDIEVGLKRIRDFLS
jgi:aspartate aminotransferase